MAGEPDDNLMVLAEDQVSAVRRDLAPPPLLSQGLDAVRVNRRMGVQRGMRLYDVHGLLTVMVLASPRVADGERRPPLGVSAEPLRAQVLQSLRQSLPPSAGS